MPRHYIKALVVLLGATAGGCRPAVSLPSPLPAPSAADITPSVPTTGEYLRFTPGLYRYQFTQTAEIQGNSVSDTIPGIVTTRALIEAEVSTQPDSSFVVTISFDSITIDTQGLIPTHRLTQPLALDSIIRGTFSQAGTLTQVHLPDSLCAYSQFVTAARELLLPELGAEMPTPLKGAVADTTTQRSCRAGTSVEMITVRQLKDIGRNPGEMELRQHTELRGLGLLRRDSVTVNGSITTRGRAHFSTLQRLPSLIQTESQGTITVQLGSTTTTFRQRSTQETRLLITGPNQ